MPSAARAYRAFSILISPLNQVGWWNDTGVGGRNTAPMAKRLVNAKSVPAVAAIVGHRALAVLGFQRGAQLIETCADASALDRVQSGYAQAQFQLIRRRPEIAV